MRGPRLLLLLLLLTAFTLTVLDVRAQPFGALRDGADAVLGPAQRAVGSGARGLGGVFGGGADQDELKRLRDENARLRGDLVRGAGDRRRADELDRLLALADAGTYPVVPAQVTALGSAFGFELTVTIDAGSRDGVQPGQTVVNGDGLVGRTTRVGPFTSTVLLVTDPGFTVGARLTREGTVGLATGDGDGGMTYELVEGGRVAVDDALLTTGSQTFVPGVPVGRVTRVDPAGALVTTADVQPFVRVAALDVVGVVTSPPRSTPRVPIPPR
ncbi:MAG: rod shape-determining protein MreC [Frankiales bacterium]|nr:rod shape-determining protein MreC [Frankiales bacterium]